MRRPVITTYVAGIPELVRPGENGWLVPAGDVDALADGDRGLPRATPARRWRAWARRRASGCWSATTSTSRRPSSAALFRVSSVGRREPASTVVLDVVGGCC